MWKMLQFWKSAFPGIQTTPSWILSLVEGGGEGEGEGEVEAKVAAKSERRHLRENTIVPSCLLFLFTSKLTGS
jgi:hypothetical protein